MELLRQHYPKMSADQLELLVVFSKKKNRAKISKEFQKYHFDLVREVKLHAIPYQKFYIYLRNPL